MRKETKGTKLKKDDLGRHRRRGRQMRKCMTTADGRSLAQVFDDLAKEAKRTNDLRDSA